jgi:hypothetical protein
MNYEGKNIIAKADGSTEDIIQALINISPRGVENVKPYINDLFIFTGDAFKDAVMIAAYIRNNVKYLADNYENQNIQLPGRLLKNKLGDCKSFSLLFYSLMTAAGHTCGYRFASYRKSKIPTHVYNWFVDNKKNFYTFDTCVFHLNESKRYTYIKDMNVNYLTGRPEEIYYIGKRDKNKPSGVKKVLLAVPRGAFLAMIRLNVRSLATKLDQSIAKNSNKVSEFWVKFGGKFDKLKENIEKGKKKKPLFGKGKGVNGIEEFDYIGDDGQFMGVAGVDDAAIAGFIASATPILLIAKNLFASLGVKEGKGEEVITPEEDAKAEEEGKKIKDPNFKAADDENEGKGSTSTVGFKPSPLLIGGAIGAVALIYILTKKKK